MLNISTCYWWHDHQTGEWIIIPACMARAQDARACSCNIPPSRLERERAKRLAAEQAAERLRERMLEARFEAAELRLSNRHWWGVLRAHGIDPSEHNLPPISTRATGGVR